MRNFQWLFRSICFLSVLAAIPCCKSTRSNSSSGSPTPPNEGFLVSGLATETRSYCGGAEPDEALLEELQRARPVKGMKYFVIEGDTNTRDHKILFGFTSDSAGKFSFRLKPGKYSVIRSTQVDPPDANKYRSTTIEVNQECLEKWWGRPVYKLSVKDKDITGLSFNTHRPCFLPDDIPCLNYTGPMPP